MKTKTEFVLSKSLCAFVNFTWPRGVIVGQLFLIWPRSTIAFSVANLARGLAAPLLVNSLLIGLEVPQHLEICHLDYFEYAKFNGGVHFFYFRPEILFSGKFGPKNQTCQCKVKIDTQTNSNMQNSMSVHLFCYGPEIVHLVQKIRIVI